VRWRTNLRLSVRALSRFKARTALSAAGVAIGIASVVVLIGAGVGAERALRKALEPLGENLLVVNAARTETGALRGVSRVSTRLSVGDATAIGREVPGVRRLAPVAERALTVRAAGRCVPVRLHGTTEQFARARNFELVAGRFIDGEDLLERRRVAVVGPLVVEELFQGELPLGETLRVQGVPFRIIGVTGKRGVSADGANEDELVIVPLTTAMSRLLGVQHLDRVYVQAVSGKAIPAARDAIASLLRRRHGARDGRADDFSIQDQTALVRARQRIGGSLSRVAIGLSALALGMGGFGLLAVSLLSVRERYGEIGLRLAVGGRPRDIVWQFLTEAALISVLGGAAGLGAGAGGILAGSALTRWPMALSWEAVVYPLMVSVAIAVVFGAYPALRAARLDPIRALNSK